MNDSPVAVVGGTGLLGQPVVQCLLGMGERVRVVARGTRPSLPGAEFVAADVRNPGSIGAALRGARAVHISLQGGPHAEDFLSVEGEGVRAVVAAARAEGVQRITLLSGLSVAAASDGHLHMNGRLPAPVFAKQCAETAVRESGIPSIIYRPSNFIEGLERSVRGRWALVPASSAQFHWLSGAEFAGIVAGHLCNADFSSRTIAVLGPEALTIHDAMEAYAGKLHPRVRVLSMPGMILGLLGIFSPSLRIGLQMLNLVQEFDEEALAGRRGDTLWLSTTIEEWCERR